jgi:hypothetical protein
MSGSTVIVGRRGLFIFGSVPEISWLNPPLQGYVYTTHASGHDINPYQSLVLNYQTLSSSQNANLLSAYWRYTSPSRTRYGESLWQAELGYGIGSSGAGIYAKAGTVILPVILLEASYLGVSLSSDESSFTLQLVSSLGFQQGVTPGDRLANWNACAPKGVC